MKRLLVLAGMMLAAGGLASSATGATPAATLTDEHFLGTPVLTAVDCSLTGNATFSFTASGVARGPYPGTFTATGSVEIGPAARVLFSPDSLLSQVLLFNETFAIDSEVGTVTGTKQLAAVLPIQPDQFGECTISTGPGGFEFGLAHLRYTAHITSAQGGRFTDQGTSQTKVSMVQPVSPNTLQQFEESFVSDFAAPIPDVPTSKDQCKEGRWRTFPQFKNQGQCISFVQSRGKNR